MLKVAAGYPLELVSVKKKFRERKCTGNKNALMYWNKEKMVGKKIVLCIVICIQDDK